MPASGSTSVASAGGVPPRVGNRDTSVAATGLLGSLAPRQAGTQHESYQPVSRVADHLSDKGIHTMSTPLLGNVWSPLTNVWSSPANVWSSLKRVRAKVGDRGMSIVTSFGVAAMAYASVLTLHGSPQSTYRISSEWSAFAGLFILALAVERTLEPFSKYLGPDTDALKQQRDEALLQRGRELTAIMVWGAATALSFGLSGALDITLLQAISADQSGQAAISGQPPFWADLLVTGLVVGAGTKPLHDLVTNLQKSKDNKNNPAQRPPVDHGRSRGRVSQR